MSQPAREKSSAAFKACKTGIIFSSDVTARGMDFPNVTYVLQVGVPMNPEVRLLFHACLFEFASAFTHALFYPDPLKQQYVHRLGRTARAGAEGRGSLVLTEDELPFLSKPQMRKLPLKAANNLAGLDEMREIMKAAMGRVAGDKKGQASSAHLGY